MGEDSIVRPGSRASIWLQAARPKTLGAAVAPVLVGTGMAYEAGVWHLLSALLALVGALLIQIGVNFHNDYSDYLKGTDTEDRIGPVRVTQAGFVEPHQMRRATVFVFAAAVVSGIFLIYRGGWPILAVGVTSIGAAIWYTAGEYSLADLGLADLFVFVFFGPVAVGGTYYVQALSIPSEVLVAGVGPGLLSIAILLVNNVRDVRQDADAGKRTLVVRFGRDFGIAAYAACVFGAMVLPILFAVGVGGGEHGLWTALPILAAPLAVRPIRTMITTVDPAKLNPLLADTGRILLLWSVLFVIGWNL